MIDSKLREQIHQESLRACGGGVKGQAFELGAEWIYNHFPRINDLARQSYNTAILRGKTTKDPLHDETFWGILEELKEYRAASEHTKSIYRGTGRTHRRTHLLPHRASLPRHRYRSHTHRKNQPQ